MKPRFLSKYLQGFFFFFLLSLLFPALFPSPAVAQIDEGNADLDIVARRIPGVWEAQSLRARIELKPDFTYAYMQEKNCGERCPLKHAGTWSLHGRMFETSGDRDPIHVKLTSRDGTVRWYGAAQLVFESNLNSPSYLRATPNWGGVLFTRPCEREGCPDGLVCRVRDSIPMCVAEPC